MSARQTLRITVGQALISTEYITLIIEPDKFRMRSLLMDFIVIDSMMSAVPI